MLLTILMLTALTLVLCFGAVSNWLAQRDHDVAAFGVLMAAMPITMYLTHTISLQVHGWT